MRTRSVDVRYSIFPARTTEHWEEVRRLFLAYADGLDFDLGFQDFERELESLPGEYDEPEGCVLIAWIRGSAVGCVGLRRAGDGISEMKRLFVEPEHRGASLGRELVCRLLEEASRRGYDRMRLDTVPAMREARALYRSLGFRPIEPYVFNPVPGTTYLERRLRRPR